MNIFERIKNILIAPKEEWETIAAENSPLSAPLMYLLLLAFVPAVVSFIRITMLRDMDMDVDMFGFIIRNSIIWFVALVGIACLLALFINQLAKTFGAVKNFNHALALVAYSCTPICIFSLITSIVGLLLTGIILPIPFYALWMVNLFVFAYGLYILYIGLTPMMNTPADRVAGYFAVSLLCTVATPLVLAAIIGGIWFFVSYQI
jgi:hypothetical protein